MSHDLIECDLGDVPIVRATLTDSDGQPVIGATVTARTLHDGTETSLGQVTEEGDGVYSVEVEPTAPGRWYVRFEATAPTKAAEEGVINVRRTGFTTS